MFAAARSWYWEHRLQLTKTYWRVMRRIARIARRTLGFPRAHIVQSWWEVRHLDRDGRLIWAGFGPNMLHDEGEKFICQVVYSEEETVPVNYYIGLDYRASLAEVDALTDLAGEPVGNGYARIAVASNNTDFTITQEGGDWQQRTKTVTFTAAGGSIGPCKNCFLTDVATGTAGLLIQSNLLSQVRTLSDGESLNVSMYTRYSE